MEARLSAILVLVRGVHRNLDESGILRERPQACLRKDVDSTIDLGHSINVLTIRE